MLHPSEEVLSPKPLFNRKLLEKELKRGVRRIMLGSKINGLYIDISPTGIVFNGYYEVDERHVLYANIRNPVEIEWSELERLRGIVIEDSKPKKTKKKRKELKKAEHAPHLIDENPDEGYLNTLPIVTMNGKKYFVDPDRRERRAVDDTSRVYTY